MPDLRDRSFRVRKFDPYCLKQFHSPTISICLMHNTSICRVNWGNSHNVCGCIKFLTTANGWDTSPHIEYCIR
jgi:hypothetical protein